MEITQYSGDVSMARHPETVLAEASLVAKSVDRLVKNRPDLIQVIGGRKHPRFELLQIVASMFRVTVRIRETRPLHDPDGWEAVAEAYHVPSGQVIAVGDGMCTRDEPTWDIRPKYQWINGKREKIGEEPVTSHQRRSMAQTRACSKALRLALGWVLGLAGYEATAAEEMPDEPAAAPQVRRKSQRSQHQQTEPETTDTISAYQQKMLWAAARGRGLTDAQVAEILEVHGYKKTADIRQSDYDRIMQAITTAPLAEKEQFDLAGEDPMEEARR
ncbi:MAG: hypothetical protein KatS3mg004_1875 [Bryobacteraceae bacterium]|nr:MAG: hypothetical protein KatS3mg004_1875 [Bryobacteraceae bacterium]